MTNLAKVGISSCVLGEKVRFDSGHKENRFVTQDLMQYFSFVSVCPEVGIGLPVPRPTIRLISDEERIALVETKDESKDYTERMQTYAEKTASQLMSQDLCGYIVCAKSPTCGMERVKVYKQNRADKEGVGIYTRELMKQMPWLPVEEDGRLNDPVLKENFVLRVFCLKDFYDSMAGEPTAGKIVAFHSRYKLTLMACHPESYKSLGRLVAGVKEYSSDEFFSLYRSGLMNALKHRASRKTNTNVLMHIQGYFKKALSADEKQELAHVIEQYRLGMLPILAPITLIRHYLGRHPDAYLSEQNYFEPYPHELRLRLSL
ncbi:2-thiouracil desulfurase family protein [Vibrio sp. JC009]|uniref:YbgA family protein n=1 Tax=Vibrio sp. JC009 TaxID=2912314 RepID=UPI0023AF5F7C|nr:2-thiouracil desulfurase family protein [Vibrio sp. JC009]WED23586.1 2-thiouracil desulfurase family protein [Vibrio sp. JC009]